jgi:NhaA family Na+:H+ antiporter
MAKKKTRPPGVISTILSPFDRFVQMESSSGILLILCTVAAMTWANSSYSDSYHALWQVPFSFGPEALKLTKPLILWINDGLMAIFFFVVGLEIKREIVAGELSTFKQAVLPVGAALGGMIMPAGIFLLLNHGHPGSEGWGIPMATDIAFSLGVLSLLGARIPLTIKVFLTAFAIVDDLGAVIVIALFYSTGVNLALLGIAALLLGLMFLFNYLNVRSLAAYLIPGLIMWYLFLKSGVHPTVAGVLGAFAIPINPLVRAGEFVASMRENLALFEKSEGKRNTEKLLSHEQLNAMDDLHEELVKVQSPLQRIEHSLHGWVSFFIMPVFAFANAGVTIEGNLLESLTRPLSIHIAVGLFAGKLIGISGFTYITAKIFRTRLPEGVRWAHFAGAAMLGGIGFTMSLFITGLAYQDAALIADAKIGILTGSLLSGLLGYLYLRKLA